jgi:hypothetical protein
MEDTIPFPCENCITLAVCIARGRTRGFLRVTSKCSILTDYIYSHPDMSRLQEATLFFNKVKDYGPKRDTVQNLHNVRHLPRNLGS